MMAFSYTTGQWLFLKGIALIGAVAFWSLWHQVLGLYGAHGILPIRRSCEVYRQAWGRQAYLKRPSLFWLSQSDFFLRATCALGIGGSVLWFFFPMAWWLPVGLATLYSSYLAMGENFTALQWDALLVEVFVLGTAMALGGLGHSLVLMWAWVLVFRFYFSNGMVKWLSRDPTWRDGTALKVHYMTQPLPGPLSWFAYHLPMWIHKGATFSTLMIECLLPFAVFVEPLRTMTAFVFIAFQALILLTGNFAFFNWAGVAMALLWIPDSVWGITVGYWTAPLWLDLLLGGVAVAGILLNIFQMLALFNCVPRSVRRLLALCGQVCVCNPYGAFAVMTTARFEWIIEVSVDGVTWEAVEFKWKPGDVQRWPRQVAPFMPRVDWHMWFAALESDQLPFWVTQMAARLKDPRAQAMWSLFAKIPFPGQPISHVRFAYYRYQFTDWHTWRSTGAVWERQHVFTGNLSASY